MSKNKPLLLELLKTKGLDELILVYHYQLLDYFNGGDVDFVEYINGDKQILQLIHFMSGDNTGTKEVQERKELAKFSEFFFTSSYNSTTSDKLLQNNYLLDSFFGCADKYVVTPQWCRVLFHITCESDCSVNLIQYFGEPHKDNNDQKLLNDSKGHRILSSLFSQLQSPHMIRNLISLLTTNDSSALYKSISRLGAKDIIIARLSHLETIGPDAYSYQIDQEGYNLCILMEEILKRHNSSELYSEILSKEVISKLVEIVFSEKPNPLALQCINILNHILDVSFNHGDYETKELPHIIEFLVEGTGPDGIKPLENLKHHIQNPVLQFSDKGFGVYRMKEIELVGKMIQTNYGKLHKALFDNDILTLCFNSILTYDTNNILHVKVSNIIVNVLYIERTDWLVEWLERDKIIPSIIESFRKEEKKACIPHFVSMCIKLARVSDVIDILKEYLKGLDGWSTFSKEIEAKLAEYSFLSNGSHLRLKTYRSNF